jgi:hypothetical protein
MMETKELLEWVLKQPCFKVFFDATSVMYLCMHTRTYTYPYVYEYIYCGELFSNIFSLSLNMTCSKLYILDN